MIKIVHLNTHKRNGGAAIAAGRLSEALGSNNVKSTILSLDDLYENASKSMKATSFILHRLKFYTTKLLSPKINEARGLFSINNLGCTISSKRDVIDADIIYIHWINFCFISLREIEILCRTGKQIFIYMHDMWHFTGGCHYSFECNNYMNKCIECPSIEIDANNSIARKQQIQKIQIFSKYKNVQVISPSRWLANCATKSVVFEKIKVNTIPNPINVHLFKKVNKKTARKILNLPQDKKIICFGADTGTTNVYKGWSYLKEALSYIKRDQDVEVLIFGSSYDQEIVDSVKLPVHFTGNLKDSYSLVLVYNAIDAFITPSLVDNFPNVIVESMVCGTPVVGFDVGGIPDLIEHKVTGYLAKYKDSTDLAKGIEYILYESDYDLLSNSSRFKIENMCSYNKVKEQHYNLWKQK